MSGKLKVTLVRSKSKANYRQKRVLDGLGVWRRHQTRELEDTPAIRGMIAKVVHMVSVEEA